ncbi:MAG: hypothetical protein FWG25_07265 [Promicromonosporaceae bacterium]|nr:hypothetical protein [Promicromonosporaceae bacterium]
MKYTIDVPDDKVDQVAGVLADHGIELEDIQKPKGKAQHRWRKAISEMRFHVDYAGFTGTVIWQKSTEMRLLAGATLMPDDDAPTRADGTLGFNWKVGYALRQEHLDAIDKKRWVTTKDIVLRSVNEVGNFMYFAGTNSWLHMRNEQGETIDELTRV